MKLLTAALIVVSTTACGITGSDNLTLHARGVVTDAATGQPIAAATVVIFPPVFLIGGSSAAVASTTTDAQGRYDISASVERNCLGNGFGFEVKASKLTYEDESTLLECDAGTQQINFALPVFTP